AAGSGCRTRSVAERQRRDVRCAAALRIRDLAARPLLRVTTVRQAGRSAGGDAEGGTRPLALGSRLGRRGTLPAGRRSAPASAPPLIATRKPARRCIIHGGTGHSYARPAVGPLPSTQLPASSCVWAFRGVLTCSSPFAAARAGCLVPHR